LTITVELLPRGRFWQRGTRRAIRPARFGGRVNG
jgi:hypothetical protein